MLSMTMEMLAALLISASPFPFEVKEGFVIEPVIGFSFNDRVDRESANIGGRLSYLSPDETDSVLTFELGGSYHRVFDVQKPLPSSQTLLEGSLLALELYLPWAFRLSLGGGAEYRQGDWNPALQYRGGVGRYLNSWSALWMDLAGRLIWRDKLSSPLELSLAWQWIF